jgi:UDP-N-acetylglucosamine--N-acetylmuramyl-(pentapeptide) pyrophosphoryl-undecaprenol N-acetylglucosamine transferase
LTFPGAASHFPSGVTHLTGLPIRPEITAATRKEAANFFQLREDKFTLLVVGGSRGSLRINQATTGLLKRYKDKDMQLVWITGSQHFEILSKEFEEEKLPDNIRVFPYLFNMEMGWAIADLAICRAGATTLSELAVRGLPAILIPYPYASEGHQEKNARYLEEKGAALIIVDEFLDEQTLFNNIEGMRRNKFRLLRMAQIMKEEGRLRALDDILDVIQDIKGSDIS